MKLFDATAKRYFRELKPCRGTLALASALNMGAVLCAVAAPEKLGELIQMLYDYAVGTSTAPLHQTLLRPALLLAALYGLYAVLYAAAEVLMENIMSRQITCKLRVKISDKLRTLPVGFIDQSSVGNILNCVDEDVGMLGGYTMSIISAAVRSVFQMLLIAGVLFSENALLACFVVLVCPLCVWLSSKTAEISENAYTERFEQEGALSELVEESFTNFATTKAFNLEDTMEGRYAQRNRRVQELNVRSDFTGGIVQPLIAFSNSLAYIGINLVGGWLMLRGGASVGLVVTVVLYARQFASPLEEIANVLANLAHLKGAAKRVFDLLDKPEEDGGEGTLPAPCRGEVAMENVDFSYRPEQPLITGLSLHVYPGQKVAIVGKTGAGKTTLVNLLMRFYDVNSGNITLDGVPYSALSREAVRSCFGMVLQDTWLFPGTIAENVAYGKPDAAREEIKAVCVKAHCDHFIRTMPKGYDTQISEDSGNLSGGQRQLLTIARAMLLARPLLILDEATSNVDTRTELLLQEAMDTLMQGRTCFVIAHRLSTIVNSDIILVLEDGHIAEQGTHRELLAKRGDYYRLYTSQYLG